jgi:FAD/FMN-containing dehydrogenase
MNEDALTSLRSRLRGNLVLPEDEGYDAARAIWNGTIDKKPAIIVRCAGVADVIDTVNFAREQGLGVSVRSGGHHVAGSSVIEGGLVLDLSLMRSVRVNPANSTVVCEGGALIGDLDRETQAFGLAVPLGLVSETGIAGLTLAGGMGWMRRKHGLSCDSLISADVVTADGQLVHANAAEHPELLWALRGGGWDLGVVVAFEFQAYPVGPEVFFTFVAYPRDEGTQVLQRFRDAYSVAPLGAAPLVVCWTFPEAEAFAPELWGKPFIALVGAYIGSVQEGEEAMEPMRELGNALVDMSGPIPWLEAQKFFDEDYPQGRRYYWKSTYLKEFSNAAIETLLQIADERPSQLSSIDIWPMGGVIVEPGMDESPLAHRQAPFAIGVECNWDDPAEDEANIRFGRESIERLGPFSTGGSYLNFEDPDDTRATAAAYGPAMARLRTIKQQYDPGNLFRSRRGLSG